MVFLAHFKPMVTHCGPQKILKMLETKLSWTKWGPRGVEKEFFPQRSFGCPNPKYTRRPPDSYKKNQNISRNPPPPNVNENPRKIYQKPPNMHQNPQKLYKHPPILTKMPPKMNLKSPPNPSLLTKTPQNVPTSTSTPTKRLASKITRELSKLIGFQFVISSKKHACCSPWVGSGVYPSSPALPCTCLTRNYAHQCTVPGMTIFRLPSPFSEIAPKVASAYPKRLKCWEQPRDWKYDSASGAVTDTI